MYLGMVGCPCVIARHNRNPVWSVGIGRDFSRIKPKNRNALELLDRDASIRDRNIVLQN